MIIDHDFRSANGALAKRNLTKEIGDIWPDQSGQILMVGFDGPISLFGFGDEPHEAIYLAAERFFDLQTGSFQSLGARLVLSPLVMDRYDAMECAEKLDRLGFTGLYRAVIDRLPDAQMVTREIKAAFPRLDFAVSELGNCDVLRLAHTPASG